MYSETPPGGLIPIRSGSTAVPEASSPNAFSTTSMQSAIVSTRATSSLVNSSVIAPPVAYRFARCQPFGPFPLSSSAIVTACYETVQSSNAASGLSVCLERQDPPFRRAESSSFSPAMMSVEVT